MMVAGFEVPSEGRILVDGKDVADLPPERRNFGVVFQGYALFPHMSVLDNVEFPLRMKHVARRQRRRQAMEMLDRVGLVDFAARRPRELSGGQQQRVALARALVFVPTRCCSTNRWAHSIANCASSCRWRSRNPTPRRHLDPVRHARSG
jgi:putative spermidine/putrescine transport system ATP-binding protein